MYKPPTVGQREEEPESKELITKQQIQWNLITPVKTNKAMRISYSQASVLGFHTLNRKRVKKTKKALRTYCVLMLLYSVLIT